MEGAKEAAVRPMADTDFTESLDKLMTRVRDGSEPAPLCASKRTITVWGMHT